MIAQIHKANCPVVLGIVEIEATVRPVAPAPKNQFDFLASESVEASLAQVRLEEQASAVADDTFWGE